MWGKMKEFKQEVRFRFEKGEKVETVQIDIGQHVHRTPGSATL